MPTLLPPVQAPLTPPEVALAPNFTRALAQLFVWAEPARVLPGASASYIATPLPQRPTMPPPPQVCPVAQAPQDETVRVRPQLSVAVTEPQLRPSRRQKVALLSGWQTSGVPGTSKLRSHMCT